MKSQNALIIDYLKRNDSIDPIQALALFSCFRLAARIGDLKDAGYEIVSEIKNKNGKKYAEYRLTGTWD